MVNLVGLRLTKNALLVILRLTKNALLVVKLSAYNNVGTRIFVVLIGKSRKINCILIWLILRKRELLIWRLRVLLIHHAKLIILATKLKLRCCLARLNIFFIVYLIVLSKILKITILKWLKIGCLKILTKHILRLNIMVLILLKWFSLIFKLVLWRPSKNKILRWLLACLNIILITLNAYIILRVFLLICCIFPEYRRSLILFKHHFNIFLRLNL